MSDNEDDSQDETLVIPESVNLSEEEKTEIKNTLEENEKLKTELFNIQDKRESTGLWAWISVIVAFFLTVALVSSYFKGYFTPSPPDPLPCYTINNIERPGLPTSFMPGFQYEFFNVSAPYNESKRICAKRNGGQLILFNNSEEHKRFNDFVDSTFKDHVANYTEVLRRRGLQMWTGTIGYFKANKQIVLDWADWPLNEPKNPIMEKFYKDSREKRICLATTQARNNLYKKAMQSKYGQVGYIVKDFTGKFRNLKGEIGCWNIRLLEAGQSLKLPFVCKSAIQK